MHIFWTVRGVSLHRKNLQTPHTKIEAGIFFKPPCHNAALPPCCSAMMLRHAAAPCCCATLLLGYIYSCTLFDITFEHGNIISILRPDSSDPALPGSCVRLYVGVACGTGSRFGARCWQGPCPRRVLQSPLDLWRVGGNPTEGPNPGCYGVTVLTTAPTCS